ncbi:MAG: DUF4352 domain-containing protein [Propionibacteriaceae bacterium]|jgi:hypothetical protein|nr:DUF4352 domain-containing protein [Propionibacteriaceae bacterium]
MLATLNATLRASGGALVTLGRDTATRLAAQAAPVGAALVFSWAAFYGSVVACSEIVMTAPWLVIPCLALGAVIGLACVVYALRCLLARDLDDAPADSNGGAAAGPQGFVAVLGATLLPFMGLYAFFGTVSQYARMTALAAEARYGLGASATMFEAFNPVHSVTVALLAAGLVAVLYCLSDLLDWLGDRVQRPWPGLVGAFVSALYALIVLLAGSRLLGEKAKLFFAGRHMADWWYGARDFVRGLWPFHLPGWLAGAWDYLSGAVWPVFWDLLMQPLMWLALAALVTGRKFGKVEDLLERRLHPPGDAVAKAAKKVRGEITGRFTGTLNSKVLPMWHSFKALRRVGWPLVGAYVIGFNALGWAGDGLWWVAFRLGSGRAGDFWYGVVPFLDLVPQVLVRACQLALAVTALVLAHRVSGFVPWSEPEAAAADSEPAAEAEPGSEAEAAPRRRGQALVVGALVVAFSLARLAWPLSSEVVHRGAPGEPVTLGDAQVAVTDVRLGSALLNEAGESVTTDRRFLVVHVAVTSFAGGFYLEPALVWGDRTYTPIDGLQTVAATAGFRVSRDVVFEVAPDDPGEPVLRLAQKGQVIGVVQDVVAVPLAVPAATAVVGWQEKALEEVP